MAKTPLYDIQKILDLTPHLQIDEKDFLLKSRKTTFGWFRQFWAGCIKVLLWVLIFCSHGNSNNSCYWILSVLWGSFFFPNCLWGASSCLSSVGWWIWYVMDCFLSWLLVVSFKWHIAGFISVCLLVKP